LQKEKVAMNTDKKKRAMEILAANRSSQPQSTQPSPVATSWGGEDSPAPDEGPDGGGAPPPSTGERLKKMAMAKRFGKK
jgi:hypothetical protein